MAAIRISDAEFQALDGESDELFRLYVAAIRPRMDFATGVVGRHPRLSYQALREWTERAARPGVKYISHDKSKLQRMLARLQQIGLLRRMGRVGEMIFACPLAERDSAGPKQADTKSIRPKTPANRKPRKASADLSTGSENTEAATHPESGKTNTPPNPPRGAEAVNPAPHACGAGGEKDPQHPPSAKALPDGEGQLDAGVGERDAHLAPHADGAGGEQAPQHHRAQAISHAEERLTELPADKNRLAEGGSGEVAWEGNRAWPVRMAKADRAYLVQKQAEVGEMLFQRVLDEWRGAMSAGVVKNPWAYFHALLQKAKEKGDAWETVYAAQVAQARQKVAQTMAQQKAEDDAFAASLSRSPGYPGRDAVRQLVAAGRSE